jgi:hypothetical protein
MGQDDSPPPAAVAPSRALPSRNTLVMSLFVLMAVNQLVGGSQGAATTFALLYGAHDVDWYRAACISICVAMLCFVVTDLGRWLVYVTLVVGVFTIGAGVSVCVLGSSVQRETVIAVTTHVLSTLGYAIDAFVRVKQC